MATFGPARISPEGGGTPVGTSDRERDDSSDWHVLGAIYIYIHYVCIHISF